jgi:hypothetical protein
MVRKAVQLAVFAAALALIAGCAATPNPLVNVPESAGFWIGLWHGMICPLALVVSWFNHDVTIYEVQNNGAWYNTGFVLGAGAWGILRGSNRDHRRK